MIPMAINKKISYEDNEAIRKTESEIFQIDG